MQWTCSSTDHDPSIEVIILEQAAVLGVLW